MDDLKLNPLLDTKERNKRALRDKSKNIKDYVNFARSPCKFHIATSLKIWEPNHRKSTNQKWQIPQFDEENFAAIFDFPHMELNHPGDL